MLSIGVSHPHRQEKAFEVGAYADDVVGQAGKAEFARKFGVDDDESVHEGADVVGVHRLGEDLEPLDHGVDVSFGRRVQRDVGKLVPRPDDRGDDAVALEELDVTGIRQAGTDSRVKRVEGSRQGRDRRVAFGQLAQALDPVALRGELLDLRIDPLQGGVEVFCRPF